MRTTILLRLSSPLLLYHVNTFVHHPPREICRTDCTTENEHINSLIFGLHLNPFILNWSCPIKKLIPCAPRKLKHIVVPLVWKDNAIVCMGHFPLGTWAIPGWLAGYAGICPSKFSEGGTERFDLCWVYSMGYVLKHLTDPCQRHKLLATFLPPSLELLVNFRIISELLCSIPLPLFFVFSSSFFRPACWCGTNPSSTEEEGRAEEAV